MDNICSFVLKNKSISDLRYFKNAFMLNFWTDEIWIPISTRHRKTNLHRKLYLPCNVMFWGMFKTRYNYSLCWHMQLWHIKYCNCIDTDIVHVIRQIWERITKPFPLYVFPLLEFVETLFRIQCLYLTVVSAAPLWRYLLFMNTKLTRVFGNPSQQQSSYISPNLGEFNPTRPIT